MSDWAFPIVDWGLGINKLGKILKISLPNYEGNNYKKSKYKFDFQVPTGLFIRLLKAIWLTLENLHFHFHVFFGWGTSQGDIQIGVTLQLE